MRGAPARDPRVGPRCNGALEADLSPADDPPDLLYDLWNAAVARSRVAVFRALAADGLGGTFTTSSGATCSLRRLAVDLVEEYARHTGHADLLREAVDGRVGEDPPGPRQAYRLP